MGNIQIILPKKLGLLDFGQRTRDKGNSEL
jgi:hypothetical protein